MLVPLTLKVINGILGILEDIPHPAEEAGQGVVIMHRFLFLKSICLLAYRFIGSPGGDDIVATSCFGFEVFEASDDKFDKQSTVFFVF